MSSVRFQTETVVPFVRRSFLFLVQEALQLGKLILRGRIWRSNSVEAYLNLASRPGVYV